ncbi:unnamed protein product [Symbiodinium natans]|uniref:Uncharacterized protein n=1 Tax=Symbiodinium natans TaxID=878477 RepID=A0A812NXI9_9DINO|nr:unnamed protein product [Symbiodinium natans]
MGRMLLKIYALVAGLVAYGHAADATAPVEMLDWATGWGDMDPSEERHEKAMAEAAQRREELARKELAEAREDERIAAQKAEEAAKGLRGSPAPATINPVHSHLEPVPSTAALDSAKEAEMKEREHAEAEERNAQIHMARATAAAQAAQKTQDPDDKKQAQKRASAELALAKQAEHNATVKRLEAKVAHEKVRFMQMQTTNGLQIQATSQQRYFYMALGGAIVGLLGILLMSCRKTRKAGETLQEPLLSNVETKAPSKEPERMGVGAVAAASKAKQIIEAAMRDGPGPQEPDWVNNQDDGSSGAEDWSRACSCRMLGP